MMKLKLLYEIKAIVEELLSLRMSRSQQGRVTKIRYNLGLASGFLANKNMGNGNQHGCQQALINIRELSLEGYEHGKTRRVRDRFSDLIEKIGNLEAIITHEMQSPRVFDRLKQAAKSITSWLLTL